MQGGSAVQSSIVSVGRGGGGGGAGAGVTGVILVRVCEPVFQNLPHSYTWPLKKRTHSYTWSSKMLTYSYTALWFFVPIFCWLLDKYQSIHVISRGKAASKILWAKNMCIYQDVGPQDVRKMGPFTQESRKIGLFIYFLLKKGGQSYTWQRWKRGLFGTHIRTMPLGSYPTPTRGGGGGVVTGQLVPQSTRTYFWSTRTRFLVNSYLPSQLVPSLVNSYLFWSTRTSYKKS